MDTENGFKLSPLFYATDPYSFGGSGNGTCVTTGPFANYTLHLGVGQAVTTHCLNRRIGTVHTGATAAVIDGCLALEKFEDMWPCVEAGQGPHGAGHGGVGGEVNTSLLRDIGIFLTFPYLDARRLLCTRW